MAIGAFSGTGTADDPVQAILGQMAEFDAYPARHDEIDDVQALAARLIGPGIAPAATLRRVHEATGIALFVTRDEGQVTGVLAFVPLNADGLAAVHGDVFNGLNPDRRHIAATGADLAGLYAWGVATARPSAAKRLHVAYDAMVRLAIPTLPVFARPATVLGERLLSRRLNFKPHPESTSGLLWIEPYSEREPAVA